MNRSGSLSPSSAVGILLSGWFCGALLSGAYSLATEDLGGVETVFLSGFVVLGFVVVALYFLPLEAKPTIYLLIVSLFLPLYAYEAYVRYPWSAPKTSGSAGAGRPSPELKEGMRVEVEGAPEAEGSFVAEEVEIKQDQADGREEVTAAIERIDEEAGDLLLLGYRVALEEDARVENPEGQPMDRDALRVGDYWKVYGQASSATSFEAERVKRRDPSRRTKNKLEGRIASEVRKAGGAQVFRLAGRQVRVGRQAEITSEGVEQDIAVGLTKRSQQWSKYEVVMEMRGAGVQAYPAVYPIILVDDPLEIEGQKIIPLGGLPLATTVFCNEHGLSLIYDSDEFGFNNPPGIWDEPVQIALVGDSYTQGACVAAEKHFSAIIRNRFPGTVSLGMAGNGPLVELAGIREYLSHYEPRNVFWFYFEGNDLIRYRIKDPDEQSDFGRESRQELLRRYLAPDFSQDLLDKNDLIREAMIAFVEQRLERKTSGKKYDVEEGLQSVSILDTGREFLTLRGLLAAVADVSSLRTLKKERLEEARELLPLYGEILRMARDEVAAWAGRLSMVYLPSGPAIKDGWEHPLRKEVLELWAELGIEVIDPTSAFRAHEDPEGLQPRHYSDEGNAIVADAVLRQLEQ